MYENLTKALRDCARVNSLSLYKRGLMKQAADAIEELSQIAAHHEQKAKDYWQEACEYREQIAHLVKEQAALFEPALKSLELSKRPYVLEAPQPRWIPVTERLPKERINQNTRDFEFVLCTTIWGDVRPFKYGTPIGQKEAHFWNGAGYVDAYVTHWMTLPEPPKEETP